MPDKPLFSRGKERKRRALRFQLLADWYGEDYAATEISAHTVQPYLLGQEIDLMVTGLKRTSISSYLRLASEWERIAGNTLARMATPGGMVDGKLFLEVRHSAMLRELQTVSSLILDKIKQEFGGDFCREIVFVAGRRRK